jgi:hypothetical protein
MLALKMADVVCAQNFFRRKGTKPDFASDCIRDQSQEVLEKKLLVGKLYSSLYILSHLAFAYAESSNSG